MTETHSNASYDAIWGAIFFGILWVFMMQKWNPKWEMQDNMMQNLDLGFEIQPIF